MTGSAVARHASVSRSRGLRTGSRFTLVRTNRFASPRDISFESIFELSDDVRAPLGNRARIADAPRNDQLAARIELFHGRRHLISGVKTVVHDVVPGFKTYRVRIR